MNMSRWLIGYRLSFPNVSACGAKALRATSMGNLDEGLNNMLVSK
jgi:hypothetical protein